MNGYAKMQKQYIVWSVILGLIVLGGVAAYLWLDLRIKKHWNLIALSLGIAAMIPTFVTALQFLLWNLSKNGTSELTLWFPFVMMESRLLWIVILPFFGGGAILLGINRAKAKPE